MTVDHLAQDLSRMRLQEPDVWILRPTESPQKGSSLYPQPGVSVEKTTVSHVSLIGPERSEIMTRKVLTDVAQEATDRGSITSRCVCRIKDTPLQLPKKSGDTY